MDKSAGIWEVLTVIAAVWGATTVAGTFVQTLRPRPIDLAAQLLGATLAAAGLGATVVLLGIEVDRGAIFWAFGFGAVLGLGTSMLTGFKDDAGETVLPGSAWFLLPWGVSSAGVLWGGLATNGTGLALGVLGMFASTGAGLGQLVMTAYTVHKVNEEWDGRPLPVGIDVVAALTEAGQPGRPLAPEPVSAETAPEACANGHSLPRPLPRFCRRCGLPVSCPNGHALQSANAAFCTTCGSPIRQVAPQR